MASNYDVGNLELSIKTMSDDALSSLDSVIEKVRDFQERMEDSIKAVKDLGDGVSSLDKEFALPTAGAKELGDEIEDTEKKSKGLGDSLKKALSIGGLVVIGKKLASGMKESFNESLGMINAYRMLGISSGEYFGQALDFQTKIQSAFGINSKDSMNINSYFQTLTTSLGIANKEASFMSETLTKLTYDLGSLFGEDTSSIYTKIQSGLIGQTKPLRNLGIDLTQQTLQGYLDNMGLDILVQQLTQAEKVALRYLAIVDQSQLAHGNLALSAEQPAHQIRILKDNVRELGMWLVNVFMGTIGRILPYINGFVMALKEVVKAIAMIFGFNMKSFSPQTIQSSGVAISDVGNQVGNVGKQADKSSKAVKKLQGLLGFNEIHNVQTLQETPSVPSGGGGGGVAVGGGGVYDDIMDSLKGYDNLMDGISLKAQKVRNDLLDWLGFLYDIDEVTGEISNVRWGGWKEMSTQAKIMSVALGGIMAYKVGKAFSAFAGLVKGSGLAKVLADIFSSASVIGWGETIKTSAGLAGVSLKAMLPVAGGVVGALGLIGSSVASYNMGKFISQNGASAESMGKLSLSIGGATASGALLGSVIPGVGTAIGALVGAIVGVTVAIAGWGFDKPIKDVTNLKGVSEETTKKMKPFEDSFKSLDVTLKKINWGNSVITQKDVDVVQKHTKQISAYLKEDIVNTAEDTKQKLLQGDIFQGLDPNDRNKLVDDLDKATQIAIEKTDALESELLGIYAKAEAEKRKLTQEETDRINAIRDEMYVHGVETLSQSQKDQDTIMRNMKANAEKMSAEQASAVVKESIRAKEGVIKEAEERYAEEMRLAEDLWKRNVISEDQYNDLAREAKLFRDEEIANANKHHDSVLDSAKTHSGEYINHINWETGEIRNRFQIFWSDLKTGLSNFGTNFKEGWNNIKDTVKNWFKDNIAPWFTLAKWKELFSNALSGLKTGWENVKTWFKEKVSFSNLKLPELKFGRIKLPHFRVTGGSWNPVDWVTGKGGIPKIGVDWYARGGFPASENGLFFANDSEMVGQFSNGKSAVANNFQIIEGIKQGVEVGVARAMAGYAGGDGTPVNVYLDSRQIAHYVDRRELEKEMTGG